MNQLYPIFLKTEHLRILIVGSGDVLLEKVSSLLEQSAKAIPEIISIGDPAETEKYLEKFPGVKIVRKDFEFTDLNGKQIVILATRNRIFNTKVASVARRAGMLVNAADMPDLCDFYLCSVLCKGDLKLGISTNGKSPVMAKRIREYFEDVIPEEMEDIVQDLHQIRNQIKGDFKTRAEKLKALTTPLISVN